MNIAVNEIPLRVLLQNRNSRLYLKITNEWTPDIKEAEVFRGVVQAIQFASRSRLPSMDVIMYFGNPRYDFRLNVTH
jgi:hypothetical protein